MFGWKSSQISLLLHKKWRLLLKIKQTGGLLSWCLASVPRPRRKDRMPSQFVKERDGDSSIPLLFRTAGVTGRALVVLACRDALVEDKGKFHRIVS